MNQSARQRLLSLLAILALLGAPRPANADDAPAQVQEPEAARVVLGILGYSRWPATLDAYRLCIAGRADELAALHAHPATVAQRPVHVHDISLDDPQLASACDALYLGAGIPPAQRLQVLGALGDLPVLTINTADGECSEGSMFCLRPGDAHSGATLLLNLDAIARSGIRVNPRVLQITRRESATP
ncbi:YfiR family protein [Pseudothauera nasutitermitis]|nr:YfiR family protein [Pseudothauera nasutitermitis]